MSRVTTRFAPSPTGLLHIGVARTALFNYVYAKKMGGRFFVRIDNTDRERSREAYEEDILKNLEWLDIPTDEVMRQSDRVGVHKEALEKLLEKDTAYISDETGTDGASASVIRFRNPNKEVQFRDTIRGNVSVDTTDLGDFIIAIDADTPLYHLANVVDDMDEGVTHIIRGEDLLSSTPRQILILEALEGEIPQYTHLPLILDTDRKKLSKRLGAVSVSYYKDEGYLPVALVNFLMLLGWHPSEGEEKRSLEELIPEFSLERIQKGGAIFDTAKLKSLNQEYMRELSDDEYKAHLYDYREDDTILEGVDEWAISLLKDRAETFKEAAYMLSEGELSFIRENVNPSKEQLLDPKSDTAARDTAEYLEKIIRLVEEVSDFSPENIKDAVWEYASEVGRGTVLWPMRVALTGKEKGPDPFTSAAILGKDGCIRRLSNAIETLKNA